MEDSVVIIKKFGLFPKASLMGLLGGFESARYYLTEDGEHIVILQYGRWREVCIKHVVLDNRVICIEPIRPRLDLLYKIYEVTGD